MQNQYSLLYREEEREMFPTLKVCTILGTLTMHTLTRVLLADVWRRRDPMVAARPWPAHAYIA